jgi:hypothetical protein
MKPSKYRAALNAYSMLMDEAKHRLSAMDIALGGKTGLPKGTGLPTGAVHDFCFLQLRMLCELIALGCLTAHGDLETGKLKRAYEADKIIRRLQRLHPYFYPHAAKQTKAGPDKYDAILLEDGFLTKEELVKLYWKGGKVLHRGSFHALSPRTYADTDFEEIRIWKKKIESLLRYHAIFMSDKKTMVLFVLRNKENNDQVQWVTLEMEDTMSILGDGPGGEKEPRP